ncbi:hypothetical protein K2X30_12205 [bacterium]|jgi:hypothetical protein|nr:hypothetical protein [bacterium]
MKLLIASLLFVLPVQAEDGLSPSVELYYQADFNGAFAQLRKEISAPGLTSQQIQNKLRLARDLLVQQPELGFNDYIGVLKAAQAQPNADAVRPKLTESMKSAQVLKSEASFTLASAQIALEKLNRTQVWADLARYETLTLVCERKFKQHPEQIEWLFWIGKSKSLLTRSGSSYLTQYVNNAGNQAAHAKEALQLIEREKNLFSN